ncbi:MAG: DNA primase [Lachnospiraceae bacterium]|nr:DNA primase [Lachnospiraceae bacterium]
MAYYSDEIIEEVRSRNDIVDVIGSYVTLRHKGNSYSACCPFHHEKTPSFHVSKDKQMYHCFGCGVGGNVYTFVMEYENFSFPEAVRYLAERSGISLPEQELSEEQKKKENYKSILKDINKSAAAYFHYLLTQSEHGAKGLEYYHGRGLTNETIQHFGLGYADVYQNDLYKYLRNKGYTDSQIKDAGLVRFDEKHGATDMFWNRVMVPILDINGKVIGFGGRVLGDGLPKYINTQETQIFDKGHTLFAMNLARRSKRRGIIICEGYMDVISMHQAGFDNAVASLGTALTLGQASLIKRYTDEVYLAYDSDEAGTKATLKNVNTLRTVGLTTRVVDLSPHKDPDEFIKANGADAFEQRITDAVTGIMYEVNTLSKTYRLKDPEEKVRFSKEVAKRLSTIEEVVSRHSYTDAVAEQYQLDRDGLKQMVTRYGTLQLEQNNPVENETRPVQVVSKEISEASKTERLLLTWMVNEPPLFDILEGIITPDDFQDENCRAVAGKLIEQYKQTHTVSPASIVDGSEDIEQQRVIACIMQTELPFDISNEEKERAINDVVKKTKLAKIDYDLTQCGNDMVKFQQLIVNKANISKLHISFKNG